MKGKSALFRCEVAYRVWLIAYGSRISAIGHKPYAISQLEDSMMDNGNIDKILDKYPSEPSSLIQVLLEIQNELRWLPRHELAKVSKKLNVPLNRIQHITTFYKAFSLVPKGRHQIHVCTGTACHVRGARRVLEVVQDVTGLKPGLTDRDFKFSLETVNCVGCCALGPVMVIDGEHHGKLAPAKSKDVLKNYE